MWAALLYAAVVGIVASANNNTVAHGRRYLQRQQQLLLDQQDVTTSTTAAPLPIENATEQPLPQSTAVPELPPERRGKQHRKQNSLNDPTSSSRKPNIILILTDDQDVELGSLQYMPYTSSLLKNEGAEFRHAYVTTPMCCPSRSSLLTGMLVHNHQVFTNNDNCSGNAWQATHETRSFATYLSNKGYRTGYVGKYLNKYNGSYVPPGWRDWAGLIMNSRYYNYSINVNGKRIKHGNDYAEDYYPDLIANDSINFLKQSKQTFSKKPVMLVMSFPAPHGPEDSAPQYSHLFFNATTHHTQAYNYAPNPDKQWILRVTDKMQPIHKRFTDLLMTKRLQTLQSVDMAVKRVYETLKEMGELDNTYIFYTSDHGYHLGQFGLVKGKSFPFEFDIKVPLLVRGPGIEAGTVVDDIVLNVDLAPTFLELSGEDAPGHMDGKSFIPLLHKSSNKLRRKHPRFRQWPDTFLIESSGRREKFRPLGGAASKTDRLNRECKLPVFSAPCQPRQKWFCVRDRGRWRKHKCKSTGAGRNAWRKVNVNRRKCTCFPQSLIPTHSLMLNLNLPEQAVQRNFLRTHLSPSQHAKIRNAGFLKTPFPRIRRAAEAKLHRRRGKRNLMGLLDSFVTGVSKQMQDLIQESNSTAAYMQSEIVTVQPHTVRSEAAKCRVTVMGKVNCSRVVYENSKQWRRSKLDIDSKIARLKDQLDTLKEIRKHLREKKPQHGVVEDLEEEGESEEDEDGNEDEADTDVEEEDDDEEEEEEEDPEEEIVTSTVVYPTTETPSTAVPFKFAPGLATSTRRTLNNATVGQPDPVTLNGVSAHKDKMGNICICQPDQIAEERRRLKELRMKKKERKLRRKMRMDAACIHEKMNCFSHDNEHWKTAPLWTDGPFCVCMNANNNTYTCLRTINATHNLLYCEFTTGHVTYYDLRVDPYQLFNRAHEVPEQQLRVLSSRLALLRDCRGAVECRSNHPPNPDPQYTDVFGRRRKPGIR